MTKGRLLALIQEYGNSWMMVGGYDEREMEQYRSHWFDKSNSQFKQIEEEIDKLYD